MIVYNLLVLISVAYLSEGRSITEKNDTALEYLNNCKCVLRENCFEGMLNIRGIGIISIRYNLDNQTQNQVMQCSDADHICCRIPEGREGNGIPPFSQKLVQTDENNTVVVPKKGRVFADNKSDVCGKPRPSINIRLLANSKDISAAIDGEFPWMTAIYKKNQLDENFKFKCAGTLISDKVVLTAAHCVHGSVKRPSDFKVLANGKKELERIGEDPEQERNIDKIIRHPDYYSGGAHNDIALLFLQNSYNESRLLNNICLPSESTDYDTTKCLATGWGTKTTLKPGDEILRKVVLPIVNHDNCQELLRKTKLGANFELHESSICAGGVRGEDTCKGDGGGPLICPTDDGTFVQIGIVSWGVDCGKNNVPGVYTDVRKFNEWILNSIEENSEKTS